MLRFSTSGSNLLVYKYIFIYLFVKFFRPKEFSGSDSELSDHEEEFYYTEVDVSVDTVTRLVLTFMCSL